MKIKGMIAGFALALAASGAHAGTVWTNWTGGSSGYPGSASGTLGGVGVTYTGEMECLNCYASNWSPASTWMGGPVTSAPPGNSGIQLFGGNGEGAITDTLHFSSAVTNPVLAIVSLGQGGIQASFNFNQPFVLLGGGPSDAWGGVPLTSVGDTAFGVEGNGLVEFVGTYTDISWTNPTYEDYYAFSVGTAGGVPEPATWAMMLVGVGAVGASLRMRRKNVMSSATA